MAPVDAPLTSSDTPLSERAPALADTGSENALAASAAGAALLLGGAILYGRGRARMS
jgi:LPXTG-motif cell wall-anchored protein